MSVLDQISAQQMKQAVTALHSHYSQKISKEADTELLPKKDEFVWLTVSVKKSPPEQRFKPIRIPVAHPVIDPRTNPVCLLTKDPQRDYKTLLETNNINFISRVIGLSKLKGKHHPFEARRRLLKEYGLFLADDRIIPLLPKLLGAKWFEAKKQPIPVSLTKKDLKSELEKAINSTYMNQNRGSFVSIKIGTVSQSPIQIQSNLQTALPSIAQHIYGGWENIQSLGLKTNSSVSLPIWSCGLGDGVGERWVGMTVEDDDSGGSEKGSEEEENAKKASMQRRSLDDDSEDEEKVVKPKKKKAKEAAVPPVPASTKSKKRKHEAEGGGEAEAKPTVEPSVKQPQSAPASAPAVEKPYKKAKLASVSADEPAVATKPKVKPTAGAEAPTSAKKAKGTSSSTVPTAKEAKGTVEKPPPKKETAGVPATPPPADDVAEASATQVSKEKNARMDVDADSTKPFAIDRPSTEESVPSKKDKKRKRKRAREAEVDGPSKPSTLAVELNPSTEGFVLSGKDKKKEVAGDPSSEPVVESNPSVVEDAERAIPKKGRKKKSKTDAPSPSQPAVVATAMPPASTAEGSKKSKTDAPSSSQSAVVATALPSASTAEGSKKSKTHASSPSQPAIVATALSPVSTAEGPKKLSKRQKKKMNKQKAQASDANVDSQEKTAPILDVNVGSQEKTVPDVAVDLAHSISQAYPKEKKDKLGTMDKKKEKIKSKLGKSVKDAVLGKKIALS